MQFVQQEIEVADRTVPLRCYIPDAAPDALYQSDRPAIVILPGGGYEFTYAGEAEPIALKYLSHGFCAFVLDYSVKPAVFPQALSEVFTVIRSIREHASTYGIDRNRIFVCGFSAGGHLAACSGTLWNHSCMDGILEGERTQYRPNALVLSYPVILPQHRGSFLSLLGGEEHVTAEALQLLSLEHQVTDETPPTFLWHHSDDRCVPVESSLAFALALSQHRIPFEMRIWETGGHGVCLGNYVTKKCYGVESPLPCCEWVDESVKFLLRH